MATATQTHAPNLTGDADFRVFAQAIHDGLAAAGLTQTSDTGQINLSTVARPGTSNTSAGYEIWRFNDTLHGTLPVFFKIEYGTASNTSRCSLWFTVGTGSDGSGAITGQAGTRQQAGCTANSATTFASIFNYDASNGLFAMVAFSTSSLAVALACVIERTRDSDGEPNADAIQTILGSSGSSHFWQLLPASGSVPAAVGGFPGSASTTTTSTGSPKSVLPIFGDDPTTGALQPLLSIVRTRTGDYAGANTFDLDFYGVNRTYRVSNSLLSSVEAALLWDGAPNSGSAVIGEPWAATGGDPPPTEGFGWPHG